MSFNILSLICIDNETPDIVVHLSRTHRFSSIFTQHTVKKHGVVATNGVFLQNVRYRRAETQKLSNSTITIENIRCIQTSALVCMVMVWCNALSCTVFIYERTNERTFISPRMTL